MYVLNANHISKSYKTAGETMRILQNVNLQVMKGEMVAIMGPSGSGKTTLLHVLTGVDTPDDGEIVIGGETFSELTEEEKAFFRRKHMGMIFQDFQLLESLTVKENILLPLILERKEADIQQERFSRIAYVLGIEKLADKGITEISGGQKQRVAIARALVSGCNILLADEPTTALDVTIQAQVLETMKDLRKKFGSAMIMITHDLGIIAEVCDEVSVVYAGQIVEHGTLEDIFNHTMHPYTEGLFGSLPNIEDRKARLQPIPGLMPDPTNLPKGCPFSPRCKYCTEACKKDRPEKKWASDTHYVRCVRYDEPGFSIERSEQ